VFLVLYTMFRSANLALQVKVALPMASVGSVAAMTALTSGIGLLPLAMAAGQPGKESR
jgi:Cu/Ag efflux pump CusA